AVKEVGQVRRQVDRAREASRNERAEAEVADGAAGARAALKLVEALEVVGVVEVEAPEGDEADAERVVRPGEPVLQADVVRAEARLAVEPVNERRVRQVGRADGEQVWNRQRVEGQV